MSENLTRAISGAVYVALLIFCTLFSPITFHILFTVFMCLSIYEFSKMTNYKYYYLFAIGGILISILFFISQLPPANLIYLASGCVVFNILLLFNLFKNMKMMTITIKRKNTKTPPPTIKADFSLLIIALTIK